MDALPITELTLRQFSGGRAIRIVAFFALIPVLFALIFLIDSEGSTPIEFMATHFEEIIAPTIMPLAILVLATNALGNELEDRTMVYLVLKPLSRMRIVLEKYAAIVITATIMLWLGTLATFLVAMRGDAARNLDMLAAIWMSVFFAVIGYGALFLMISLLIPRALLAGILYSLLWETTFSRFIPGIRVFSIRHYVQSIYARVFDNPIAGVDEPMRLISAVVTIVVIAGVTLAIASWRLSTMNLE